MAINRLIQFLMGDVAAGATDSGNPVKVGGKSATTTPTAVTAGQRVNSWWDVLGRLFVTAWPQFTSDTILTATVNVTSGAAGTDLVADPGVGNAIYLVGLQVSNQSSSTGVRIDIRDDVTPFKKMYLPPNGGGFVWSTLVPRKITTHKALTAILSATGDVLVNVDYYIGVP